MNGNAHFMFGASVGVGAALALSLNPTQATLLVSTCLLGSIFPDIDNPKSNVGQLTAPVSTVIGKIAKAEGKYGSHHRGMFHDPFFYTIGLILAFFFYKPLIKTITSKRKEWLIRENSINTTWKIPMSRSFL